MSYRCTACRGTGRIGEGYKSSVKYRGLELETLEKIFTYAIEKSHSEANREQIQLLKDRLFRPAPKEHNEQVS